MSFCGNIQCCSVACGSIKGCLNTHLILWPFWINLFHRSQPGYVGCYGLLLLHQELSEPSGIGDYGPEKPQTKKKLLRNDTEKNGGNNLFLYCCSLLSFFLLTWEPLQFFLCWRSLTCFFHRGFDFFPEFTVQCYLFQSWL